MHRIVYLDRASTRATVRRPAFEHEWIDLPQCDAADVVARLAGATIAISNKVPIDRAAITALPDLKMIAVAATGTNQIDLDAARERGIVVSNIRGYAVNTVPEQVIAMLFALSRNLFAYRAAVAAGEWQKSSRFCLFDHPIRDLFGQTIGIVGRGNLGEGVARRAEALGMRVLFADRKGVAKARPGYTAFADVLTQADAISLHCPLTEATRGMIGAHELARMKPHAILINTARGGLVDEAALADALRAGTIGGAAFDVLTEEPPVKGNVLLDPDLLALPNFLVTPHCAWASDTAMQVLTDQLVDNIEAFVAGRPRNVVT
jgi:glycerate dehydrogenase